MPASVYDAIQTALDHPVAGLGIGAAAVPNAAVAAAVELGVAGVLLLGAWSSRLCSPCAVRVARGVRARGDAGRDRRRQCASAASCCATRCSGACSVSRPRRLGPRLRLSTAGVLRQRRTIGRLTRFLPAALVLALVVATGSAFVYAESLKLEPSPITSTNVDPARVAASATARPAARASRSSCARRTCSRSRSSTRAGARCAASPRSARRRASRRSRSSGTAASRPQARAEALPARCGTRCSRRRPLRTGTARRAAAQGRGRERRARRSRRRPSLRLVTIGYAVDEPARRAGRGRRQARARQRRASASAAQAGTPGSAAPRAGRDVQAEARRHRPGRQPVAAEAGVTVRVATSCSCDSVGVAISASCGRRPHRRRELTRALAGRSGTRREATRRARACTPRSLRAVRGDARPRRPDDGGRAPPSALTR